MDKDIFGLSIYKYWKGSRRLAIKFIRDDGKEFTLSPKFFFTEYKGFSDSEKKLLKHVKGRVLDVGCGAGRHLLYLQKKGYDAVGIDSSKYLVRICKRRGGAKCFQADIYAYRPGMKFDTILLFGNNLGIAKSIKNSHKLFKILRGLLTKNGRLLLTSIDYEKTPDNDFRKYVEWNRKKGKDPGQLITKNVLGKQATGWVKWLYLTPEELRKICSSEGLVIEKIYRERNGSYGAIVGHA